MKKHLLRFSVAVFAFSVLALSISAQKGTYAITNIEVVTVSGPTIKGGTVVIRDGLIEAVGTSVKVPADALVLDGTGLTVYPGFFDTNSSLGISKRVTPPGQGNQPGAADSSNSNYPASLRPVQTAFEDLKAGEDQFKTYRNAGITTVVTGSSDGIFNGQSAIINLAGDSVSEMIIRSRFAQNIAFNTDRQGYPRALLGTFAAIRQMFNDARRLDEIKTKYAANPKGMKRPEADPDLEALIPVVKGQMNVVIFADTEREIIRALDLTKEYGLKTIIAGGLEAGKAAARIKAQNIPVLLTLDFPVRTIPENDDEDPELLRTLRLRVAVPKNAALLKSAGVRFAFQSGGLKNIGDYVKNAGLATENGLSKDDAIRAMTLSAAELLGVQAQLGSIETGKIANLVVSKGGVFEKESLITHVFVDGKMFEQPKKKPAKAGDNGGTAVKAGGTWDVTVEAPGMTIPVTISLNQSAASLTGTIAADMFGSADIRNGKITADGFEFDATVDAGGQTLNIAFSAVIKGDSVEGTVITDQGPASFTGTRRPGK